MVGQRWPRGFEPRIASVPFLSPIRCRTIDLNDFYNFLVDGLSRSPSTAKKYRRLLERFFECEREICRDSVMNFLKRLRGKTATKANFLKALFRLCKDYLGRPDVVVGLRVPRGKWELKEGLIDEEVRKGFGLLKDAREEAIYIPLKLVKFPISAI